MKAIILCAWEWKRLRPLTENMPKPMIKVLWKSILERILDNLVWKIDEAIIIVKYKKEAVISLWENYRWIKLSYKEQWDKKWTWWAVEGIKIDWDFICLYWDTIIDKKDIEALIWEKEYWVLTKKVDNPEKYWVFKIDENNFVVDLVEKPKEFIWNLASLWVYRLPWSFLNLVDKIEKSERWEYEITDSILEFAKNNKFKTIEVKKEIIDITSPKDLEIAKHFFEKKEDIYKIWVLNKEIASQNIDRLIEIYWEMRWEWEEKLTQKKALGIIEKMLISSDILYIDNSKNEIVWVWSVLKEWKMIRWWVLACRIEDVIIKSEFRAFWLWKMLMKETIEHSKKIWAYKITLSARQKTVWFYEKLWFANFSQNMKMYLK